MDLIGNRQAFRRDAERRGHAGAVFRDRLRRVARTDAAVERGVNARGNAAARVKKACATPGARSVAAVRQRSAHAGFAAFGWKPGGGGSLRLVTAIALNSAPISPLPLPTRRLARLLEILGPFRSRSLGERLGPEVDADRAQEVALVDRPVDGRAGGARAARHRGEIDMGGQVAVAGRGKRVDVAMCAQGLKRVAEAGDRMAVVDQQRRAALLHQPRAEFEHEPMAGGVDFEHLAVLAAAPM